MQPFLDNSNFQLLAGHFIPAWCWDVHSGDYLWKKTNSRREEASLFLLCQKWPVRATAPLYWLLSWLAVNWKIANESSMFCLCCNVPGHYVLCSWAEQSCLWCGACLHYLWLHGVPNALWEMQGLHFLWGGAAGEGYMLKKALICHILCPGRQRLGTWPCTTSTFICQSPHTLFHLRPTLPNIHRNTQELCFWAMLRVYHAQRTYENTWENGLQIFPSRFSLWGGW